MIYPTAPRELPLQQATQRLWMIRHLWSAQRIDPRSADTALASLQRHSNDRIRALALTTALQISRDLCGGPADRPPLDVIAR